MISLLDRLTGTADDPEETTLTTPPRRTPPVPGANGIPWYAGVPGLDPGSRVADWYLAARCAAMACAALALGAGAGHRTVLRSAPAGKWCAWLLSDGDEVEVRVRILALRLTCEQAHAAQGRPDADDLLRAAQDLHAACAPR